MERKGRARWLRHVVSWENELRQYSKEEGVTMADSVENWCVHLRKRVKRLGAKEQARRKKGKVRFSMIKKNKVFQKSHMKVVVAPTERLNIEETDGSNSGQEEYDLFVLVHGTIWPRIRRRDVYDGLGRRSIFKRFDYGGRYEVLQEQ